MSSQIRLNVKESPAPKRSQSKKAKVEVDKRAHLEKRIIITGGGSGGHISPAKGIIEELERRYSNIAEQILYLGGKKAMSGDKSGKSLESKLIGEKGNIQFKAISSAKLQRKFEFGNLLTPFETVKGIIEALIAIQKFKPDMVISTGGYVTVPVCIAAWLSRVPIYIHEQTVAVGLTNKIVGNLATKIFITFKDTEKYFPRQIKSNKVFHVGNPVRPSIFRTDGEGEVIDKVKSMQKNRKKLPMLLIMGGGQGSHLINKTIIDLMPRILEKYQLILQTGDNQQFKDYDDITAKVVDLPEQFQERIGVFKYVSAEEMGYLFKNVDLFIGRAGANTVYEIGIMQVPSIFIPIPWVTHNEQYRNAKVLVDQGLSRIISENELTGSKLKSEVEEFLKQIKVGLPVNATRLKTLFPINAIEPMLEEIGI